MQLTNEQIKTFAIQLAMCESETAVIELLDTYGFWNDSSCWKYFGGVENNYSSIGNQQASSDAALVEKIINSIDAVIMGDLMSRGIDPKSEQAPQSIRDYLKIYRNIPEGKLSLLDHRTRQKISEDILLVSTANPETKNPNYSIIDNGEGQTPNSMETSILSLQASNKLRVGAVQGKFNMGGTGVLNYSGKHRFEIIISKKRQDIAAQFQNNDDSFDKWSVTIVRREEPTGTMKSSCFKYLAPNGKLLMFEANELPLKPRFNTNEAIPYCKTMKDGTFMKIFDYNIKGANSVSTIHLHDKLSLLIPGIALPIKLIECRKTQAKRNKTLYGLTARLEENRQETLECPPIGTRGYLGGEPIQATIYVFKKGKGESFKKNEGILYTLNGQCQGVETKRFFEKLKLGYLAKSILVILDCSQLSTKTIEELFMNSRDRLKKGPIRDELIQFLEDELKKSTALKELNAKRREEELKEKVNNPEKINHLVENVLTNSKALNKLMLEGVDIHFPTNHRSTETVPQEPSTNQFPTYFRLSKKNRKTGEIGRKIRIELETDAPNDYFTRDNLPGDYLLTISESKLTDYALQVSNQKAYLSILIDQDIFQLGKEYSFELIITNEADFRTFEIPFKLTMIEKNENSTGGNNPPKNRMKKQKTLPPYTGFRKDEWERYNANEKTAIKIIPNDESYDFYCNLDNKYLLSEILTTKENTAYLEGIFMIAMMVSSMTAITHYETIQTEEEPLDIPEMIEHFSSALAPTILPIISELSKIESFDEKE